MVMQTYPPVLAVDDDADIRDALHSLLNDAGYGVVESSTASEAIHFLQGTPVPHIVLLDYLLPDGGASVLRAAEAQAPLQRHCYVLVTAAQLQRIPEDERRLIDTLCLEVVSKPFEMDALLDVVTAAALKLTHDGR